MDINQINFDKILSSRSAFGLIWTGCFRLTKNDNPRDCVIKMVMLTSGIHFDKTHQVYLPGQKSTTEDEESRNKVTLLPGFQPNKTPISRPLTQLPLLYFPSDCEGRFPISSGTKSHFVNKPTPNSPPSGSERESPQKELKKYFEKNDTNPFRHKDFRHRRAMTKQAFLKEVTELTHLGCLGMAPTVYGYCFSNQSNPIHYGFIVMEKVDCSVKDVLLKRSLEQSEEKIINQLINYLHNQYGSVHGDLKPNNIGVYLNKNRVIERACFFDCQKIKHKEKYSPLEFQKLIEKDWKIYCKYSLLLTQKKSNKA